MDTNPPPARAVPTPRRGGFQPPFGGRPELHSGLRPPAGSAQDQAHGLPRGDGRDALGEPLPAKGRQGYTEKGRSQGGGRSIKGINGRKAETFGCLFVTSAL